VRESSASPLSTGCPASTRTAHFVTSGGLASLGTDLLAVYDQAASHIDRILKGEKPGDVPVQQPAKSALVLNLQTAKKIGVEIPPTVMARATEVIE
jgi:putative ABC transport system substrate-binding protein